MDLSTLLTTIITLIFIIISFQEFRLNRFLRLHQQEIAAADQMLQWQRLLRIESIWNLATWVIIILLFILPDHYFFLLASLLLLAETLLVHQMDRIKSKINQH